MKPEYPIWVSIMWSVHSWLNHDIFPHFSNIGKIHLNHTDDKNEHLYIAVHQN